MNPMHAATNYNAQCGEKLALGGLFLMWLFYHLECGAFGPNPLPPRALKDAVQKIDPGYCIDAPETLPAGGMTAFEAPPCDDDDEPVWLPEMLTVERDSYV